MADVGQSYLPNLVIRYDDLTITARELATLIAQSGQVFDRAGPVQIYEQSDGHLPRVTRLGVGEIVHLAHRVAQPIVVNRTNEPEPVTLPERVAKLYQTLPPVEWGLQLLKGMTTAPLLLACGSIRVAKGYDMESGLWCAAVPNLVVPQLPSRPEALAALRVIRQAFCTFPFADSERTEVGSIPVVNTAAPPGNDETAFLVALLTAICRSSLPLAPGLLVRAPLISGAGTGKGRLVRAICQIAYGIEPRAFAAGGNVAELDKRIGAALLDATQVIFIDNVNGITLRSDLLASILTEREVDMRPLGTSRMLPLCPNAFVAVTGNGVSLSEDLTRRLIVVELDAHMEDPEGRPFAPGYLAGIASLRPELLAAGLTIWRWGRQNEGALAHGRPLGSYEEWCRSVRDPLLSLGCADPVVRISATKANDPMRINMAAIFEEWHEQYGTKPVKAADLANPVRALIDPQCRGRQFVADYVGKHVGTRVGGFVMTAQKPLGKWGATTYALRPLVDTSAATPMPPMIPMPYGTAERDSDDATDIPSAPLVAKS